MKKTLALAAAALALSGCAATSSTTLSSSAPNSVVAIYDHQQVAQLQLPQTKAYRTTSFGGYEFKAAAQGKQPLYGLLPLKVNGGNVAVGILLFPPALLATREVYPYYDFDLEHGMVRYRVKDTDGWAEYKPSAQEAENARKHIDSAASAPAAAKTAGN